MRLLNKFTLVLMLMSTISLALADDNKFYVQFNAGGAIAPDFILGENVGSSSYNTKENYKDGFVTSLALGYRLMPSFRMEGELMYQANNRDTQQLTYSYCCDNAGQPNTITQNHALTGERKRSAFLINGYYDFKNKTAFTPYIGAGLGVYHLEINQRKNDMDFAWQAGAGLNYQLNNRVSVDVKYRYFGGADAELGTYSPLLYSVGDHQLMAGIRIGF